jgi:hypothetical protein
MAILMPTAETSSPAQQSNQTVNMGSPGSVRTIDVQSPEVNCSSIPRTRLLKLTFPQHQPDDSQTQSLEEYVKMYFLAHHSNIEKG